MGICNKDLQNGKFICKCNIGDKFKINPTFLESSRYEHITCSYIFIDLGFGCYNQSIKVKYIDEIGNWAIENDKLVGYQF